MHIYCSVDPQLEGYKIELFWPVDNTHDEAPERKDIAPLVLWRLCYGFVENHTFFNMMEQFDSMWGTRTFFYIMEQFDSMGVPGHFTIH